MASGKTVDFGIEEAASAATSEPKTRTEELLQKTEFEVMEEINTENEDYLKEHPEISILLHAVMDHILREKPPEEAAALTAAKFLSRPLPLLQECVNSYTSKP